MSDEKTNVMRILDKAHIPYDAIYYEHRDKEAVDGITVAQLTGMDEHCVFKTLVLRGVNKNIYIFVIPVCCELDLKKLQDLYVKKLYKWFMLMKLIR